MLTIVQYAADCFEFDCLREEHRSLTLPALQPELRQYLHRMVRTSRGRHCHSAESSFGHAQNIPPTLKGSAAELTTAVDAVHKVGPLPDQLVRDQARPGTRQRARPFQHDLHTAATTEAGRWWALTRVRLDLFLYVGA